jgi:hypothetical protein
MLVSSKMGLIRRILFYHNCCVKDQQPSIVSAADL